MSNGASEANNCYIQEFSPRKKCLTNSTMTTTGKDKTRFD